MVKQPKTRKETIKCLLTGACYCLVHSGIYNSCPLIAHLVFALEKHALLMSDWELISEQDLHECCLDATESGKF